MGIAEELEIAQLGVKQDRCWCGHFSMPMMFWWQPREELQAMLVVVEAMYEGGR